ncbi:aldo/keto reductase [Parasedimentitalea marina]|uniref:Aldo/keto reductase n=2 Tax=Parasedimentitalea marina TaxID=2483033 RepID=A0A3T0MZ18_9RHOB|nr:aldo/keto reductase [Parasedimentitalea marina]
MIGAMSIGLGFASLGASQQLPLSDDVAENIFEAALALNITRFDTSPLYGGGQSEDRLGKLLKGQPRDSYILSTKVGRYRPYGAVLADQRNNPTDIYDYSADACLRSIEKSLERLGVDRFDIVFIHDCDRFVKEAVAGAFPALCRLRDQGVIGSIGCASNTARTHEAILNRVDLDVLMVANSYSLLTQDAGARLLPFCLRNNISVELAAPFNSGILATGPGDMTTTYRYATPDPEILDRTRRIAAICDAYGVPLKRAALQYCARHPAVERLILGLVEPDDLRCNMVDMQMKIPSELWADLAEIGVPDPIAILEKSCRPGSQNYAGRPVSKRNIQTASTAHENQKEDVGNYAKLQQHPISGE